MKRYGVLALKVILGGVGILLFLLALAFILIRVPAVQNYARLKTVSYLQNKLRTKVEINKLSFDFPKVLVLEDVYFEDQNRDTLIAGDTLRVNLSLFKIFNNEWEVNELDLRGVRVNVNRTLPDSTYNFDYIVKAFIREQNKTPQVADSSVIKFSLHDVSLDRIRTSYHDAVTGSDVSLYLGHLDTKIRDFDSYKMKFTIPAVKVSGVNARIIQNKPAAKPESYTKDSVQAASPRDIDLTLGTINLDKVKIYYQNDISSVKSDINLGKLNLEADDVDMRNRRIALKNLTLKNSKILFQLGKTVQAKIVAQEASKEVKVQAQNWQVSADNIDLENNDIIFDDFNMPVLRRGMDYSHMNIKGLSFKASNFVYAPDSTAANITQANFRDKSGFQLKDLRANFLYSPRRVRLDNLYLETPYTLIKNEIRLNYSSVEDISRNIGDLGIDADLKGSRVGLRDVLIFMPDLAGIDPFKRNPDASFNMNARVTGKVSSLNIPLLEISGLTNTRLSVTGNITGLPDAQKAFYNLNIRQFRSGSRDLSLLVSHGVIPASVRIPSSFSLSGNFKGRISNFNTSLNFSGLSNTRVRLTGNITGLPDTRKAYYNINIRELRSGSRDVNALVAGNVIPASIRLPESFNLSGNFKGRATDFNTSVSLSSSFGSARAVGSMKGETYNADIRLNNFYAGRLLRKEDIMGHITASAKVNGSGFDPKGMRAKFSADVQNAELNGYPYRNLVISGNVAGQNITTVASIKDPNIRLQLDAKANIAGTYPSLSFTVDIDSANLKALKLYDEQLLLRGKIAGDLPSTDPDRLIGRIDASDMLVVSNGKRYLLDSIQVRASASGQQRDLRVRSDILTGNLTGRYTLTEVGNALTNEINRYFKVGDGKTLPVSSVQDFSFAVHIVNPPVLRQFIPQLTSLDKADIAGNFNSSTGTLTVNGAIPQVTYMGYSLSNLNLKVNTGGGALNYSANFDQLLSSSLKVNKTTLSGKAQNNLLDIDLGVKDPAGKDQYRIAGLFSVLGDQYQFKFNQNGLMLNYQPWNVSADNALQFGPRGILAHNFGLSRAGQQLAITSNPEVLNAPLSLNFTDFRIETLTMLAKQDTLLAGGVVNGNALVKNWTTSPEFTADLTIKDFNFMADTLGDIALQMNNSRPNTYAANARVTGKGNDLVINGLYYIKPESSGNFDLDMDINTLNLASIQGFTMGYMREASGSINGNLKITGTFSAPVVRGDVNFRQAAFNLSMLNSLYRIPDDRVSFTSGGIAFDSFTVLDSAGNEAVLDGMIYTTNYKDFRFGLALQTDNFRALNSTKKDNDLYYGTVYLSSSLKITGDLNKPVVTGEVDINDKTVFTVVLPQNNPAIQERQGIVEFINASDPESMRAFSTTVYDTITSDIRRMDVSMNIVVDSLAVFNIIIDEGNGDYVRMQGQSELSAGIDPSGKISLTGNYVLAKGAYEMSYGFIKRRFDIRRGSTITWTGEPTAANLNVDAVYVANTSPLDLVDNQLGSVTATERNRYKQKLPFEVYLNITGELLKPVVRFDIGLPTGRNYYVSGDVITLVNARLEQVRAEQNELNKQVFSLLLLNRFTSENPFDTETSGNGVEAFVRQSVSQILTDQLNNIAGTLIQGVDLNFDLVSSEDYTTGSLKNRTDLNVGLSKRLLNDKFKVTIGSNFELEGPQSSNRPSNAIAGNIALDYQLSQDGRYLLRAYRKNVTEAVVEGYVIETGLGFIINMDYNKFKELFMHRTAEDKFIRKENKKVRKQERKEGKQPPEPNA